MFPKITKASLSLVVKRCVKLLKALQVMWIVTTLSGYHVLSSVTFWLLRFLRISSLRSDLRGHVTDGKTQFLPSVSFYWLVGLGANWLITE